MGFARTNWLFIQNPVERGQHAHTAPEACNLDPSGHRRLRLLLLESYRRSVALQQRAESLGTLHGLARRRYLAKPGRDLLDAILHWQQHSPLHPRPDRHTCFYRADRRGMAEITPQLYT